MTNGLKIDMTGISRAGTPGALEVEAQASSAPPPSPEPDPVFVALQAAYDTGVTEGRRQLQEEIKKLLGLL